MTLAAGGFATADKLNGPVCSVRQTVSQNLSNNAFTVLTFTSEDVDTHAMHSNSVNPSRITCVREGYHVFMGASATAPNGTGARGNNWLKNGANQNRGQAMYGTAGAGTSTLISAKTITLYLVVGDYVELQAFQDSGGLLATRVAATEESYIDVYYKRR